jgi:hypothetical protein
MHRFACSTSNNLTKLLREKYDVRDRVIGRGCHAIDLLNAGHDLITVQRAISYHHRHCQQCSLNLRLETGLVTSEIRLRNEVPIYPIRIDTESAIEGIRAGYK